MMKSLAKLNALPEDTKVYCGHEYTVKNLQFALALEPSNAAIADKLAWAQARRAQGQATVPSTIASERATNPFLRTSSPELRDAVRKQIPSVDDDDVLIFGGTRKLKDDF